jgi:hypothetical protein
MKLLRCDRCDVTAENVRGITDDWGIVAVPNGRPDPIFGTTYDTIQVCSDCLRPDERLGATDTVRLPGRHLRVVGS